MFSLLEMPHWDDYELIDCGNGNKLERFGPYTLIRPEPQALWDSRMTEREWRQQAHAAYYAQTSTKGEWEPLKKMPDHWRVTWQHHNCNLAFNLRFTSFKHVGIFPEQTANWTYLLDFLKQFKKGQARVLNLFAYTGGASLAAKCAGADVYHLDSVKQVVSWARANMEDSKLSDIRWVVEDAVKFVQREQKRGNTYNAIIMDPPSYGIGPSGERWKLEEGINELMKATLSLLDAHHYCFIMNTYSLNLSPLILKNLVHSVMPKAQPHFGELYIQSTSGQSLPLGSYVRMEQN